MWGCARLAQPGIAGTVAGTVTVSGHQSFLGTSILLCMAVVALAGMVRLLKQFSDSAMNLPEINPDPCLFPE